MTARLGSAFITAFPAKITALTGGATAQSSQTGDLSQLTVQQQMDFQEMERLTAGARRTARLVFPGHDTVPSAEFQVGEAGSKALSATIARARLTHAAALKYATDLHAKGWIPADTTALGVAISALAEVGTEQEQASDERLGLTNEKIIAANALHADCLTIQNAARLKYPAGTDAAGNAKNITERARFLLEEFPPRDREKPDGGTQDSIPPAPQGEGTFLSSSSFELNQDSPRFTTAPAKSAHSAPFFYDKGPIHPLPRRFVRCARFLDRKAPESVHESQQTTKAMHTRVQGPGR